MWPIESWIKGYPKLVPLQVVSAFYMIYGYHVDNGYYHLAPDPYLHNLPRKTEHPFRQYVYVQVSFDDCMVISQARQLSVRLKVTLKFGQLDQVFVPVVRVDRKPRSIRSVSKTCDGNVLLSSLWIFIVTVNSIIIIVASVKVANIIILYRRFQSHPRETDFWRDLYWIACTATGLRYVRPDPQSGSIGHTCLVHPSRRHSKLSEFPAIEAASCVGRPPTTGSSYSLIANCHDCRAKPPKLKKTQFSLHLYIYYILYAWQDTIQGDFVITKK